MTSLRPPKLDTAIFRELVLFLTRYMTDEKERRALLLLALNDAAYQGIKFDGSADTFTPQMVSDLLKYGEVVPGKQAVAALLEILRDRVGFNEKAYIDDLQRRLMAHWQVKPAPSSKPKLAVVLMGSLVICALAWIYLRTLPMLPTVLKATSVAGVTAVLPIPTATPKITPAPAPTSMPIDRAQLKHNLLVALDHSTIGTDYPSQAERFVDVLFAHLDEFQLPTLQITPDTMQQALNQPDVGARINAMIQRIWAEWILLSRQQKFDLWTTEPTYRAHHLSPFRQLIIRMIQNRQGVLIDNQQHALHNFLTRDEDPANWRTGVDGIVCAINRESFQWQCIAP